MCFGPKHPSGCALHAATSGAKERRNQDLSRKPGHTLLQCSGEVSFTHLSVPHSGASYAWPRPPLPRPPREPPPASVVGCRTRANKDEREHRPSWSRDDLPDLGGRVQCFAGCPDRLRYYHRTYSSTRVSPCPPEPLP